MELVKILQTVKATPYSAFFFTPPYYEKSYSYLFQDPYEIVAIKNLRQYYKKLREINLMISGGYSAFALLRYEAGFLFEKKLHNRINNEHVLIEFVFFKEKNVEKLDSSELTIPAYTKQDYRIKNFRLNTGKANYTRTISKIKDYIKAGDTYQVNFTLKGKFGFEGDIANLFIRLVSNQSARYTAFINTNREFILSISPELFFEIKGNIITTRPMKGTIQRGVDLQTDSKTRYDLQMHEKNRAENVMIVDLLRNDLGRISRIGSVRAEKLFEIEKYESLYQMVSEINSTLKKHITLTDILKNIYPCGSITGAPKLRTMEIIKEVEKEPRGIYTGSIGFIHKKKKIFNVAIRTLVINKKSQIGEIGLGSGIVWDSDVNQEYEETLLKSKFLTKPENDFELFETMLFENGQIILLEDHLNRLSASASYFLYKYNESDIKKRIRKAVASFSKQGKTKIKLFLDKWGKIRIELTDTVYQPEIVSVILSQKRVNSADRYQYFKTTNRNLYDKEHKHYSGRGLFDVLFFNERNELAEGAITNIFLKYGDTLVTPPVSSGILSGVYRKYLIRSDSNIKERILYYEDLMSADEIILTNAVRGKIKVDRLYLNTAEYRSFMKT
jgi:para-aminobenzoate synthetase / 4-amino-4-deoxychorismate lyase